MGQNSYGRSLQPGCWQIAVATWNVKGLTDVKLHCICSHMLRYGVDIICLQETWASQAEYYNIKGYKVILSGSDAVGRTWAGVGFVVSPRYASRVCGFLQFSDRLASLKLKVAGGKVGIINGYAPHNLKPMTKGTISTFSLAFSGTSRQ